MIEIDWTNPDYAAVFASRQDALQLIRENPKSIPKLKEYYRDNWVDFINDWGMTFDPRKDGQKYTPFILFPRQEEYINWIKERYESGERGLAEKSRDVGFTWLSVAAAVCIWLFIPHAIVGFGSRKKELVDNGTADADSIFWKIRAMIDYLPVEFLPEGHEKARKVMIVPNPSNGALIKGEIGDEIGRGGRAGIYFVDEFAHLEHPDMAESALSATTDCRIYLSTVNGAGNLFYRLRHFLPEKQIFIFDWKDDPRKRQNPDIEPEDEPWYQKQKRELLPTTLASQVDRNYNASVANTFLGDAGSEALRAAFRRRLTQIQQPKDVPWVIGIDAAGQGNDDIVIWRRRGRINLPVEKFQKMDGVQLAGVVTRLANELLQSGPLALIAIERDGPGGSCADQLSYGPFASILVALHTGAKLKDGRHYNVRAWLHQQALDYLLETECYIPENSTFEAQATAIQCSYKGGLLLIESKDEYRSRFATGKSKQDKMASKSPDHWDAFMLSFAQTRAIPIPQNFDQDFFLPRRTQGAGWRPRDPVMGY